MRRTRPEPDTGRVGAAVLDELTGIVGPEHVRATVGETTPYATPLFAHQPDAVVFPASTEEVATTW